MNKMINELFSGEVFEVPERLTDVLTNIIKTYNKQTDKDIKDFEKHVKDYGIVGVVVSVIGALENLIEDDEASADDLVDIIMHLMMLVEVNDECVAEETLNDLQEELPTLDDYIVKASNIDLDSLSTKEIARLGDNARGVILGALTETNMPLEIFYIRRELARFVYMVETTFIPDNIHEEILDYMSDLNKRFKEMIKKYTKGL